MFLNKIHFEIIDSTNQYLKDNYLGLDNLTFVSSDIQTKGRGRNNRNWISEKGNLMFSVLIKDEQLFDKYKALSIVSAYTIIESLKELGINNLSIKWPNDVYYQSNKLCGILLESVSTDRLNCLIIGIGLNVNTDNFQGDYIIEPTSLKKITGKNTDIDLLKDLIFDKLVGNLKLVKNDYDFYSKIKELDYLKNKKVFANINNKKEEVTVKGIDYDYSLKIVAGEKEINVETGEISFHV